MEILENLRQVKAKSHNAQPSLDEREAKAV